MSNVNSTPLSVADQIKDDKTMPVAIVGLGGRFPGDASNPDKLWELLSQGRSALTDIPQDRYNMEAFYHPHAERLGAQNFKGAHFMNRPIEAFDAPFFSITPNEAKAMDPQQRMCLEVAYEAMENAGIRMENLIGSNTSCYVGCFTQDYANMMSHDNENLPAYYPTGVAASCLSNRVSWFYDLRGPSMTVDTACSSSLVALHLAAQSLRTGESELSLVGGVNFMISPEYNVTMTTLHFLGPDSKSMSFDEKGNGYARGEGCSFVVLKPLAAAIRDNDVIRAVIRNTGCNQDGNTPGITLPSSEAQAALIRRTYGDAGLDLADTGYFEAHGTGTAAGDPIETSALGATFGKAHRTGDPPLWVGSVKANIGHLEGASGLAGLTKAVYVLEKGLIPKQVWLENVNPRILLDQWNLALPRELTPFPREGLRRVSINSFGFGGANAHAILDDAYHYLKTRGIVAHHNTEVDEPSTSSSPDSGVALSSPSSLNNDDDALDDESWTLLQAKLEANSPKLLVWSAHEQVGIKRITDIYATYLSEKAETTDVREQDELLERVAYTTAARRSILPWKSFVVGSSLKEIAASLDDVAKPLRSSKVPKLGFVFTGQGAQHAHMGRELWTYQIYRESLKAASAHLTKLGCTWSLVNELWKDEKSSNVNAPEFSQPLCTAVQVAVVELFKHWGITPAAVVGHSSGEIGAAFAKGAISREDAWSIAYHRGRLSAMIKTLAPQLEGAMLACGVGEEEAQAYLAKVTDGHASVACINSPSSVTISGDASAVSQMEALLQAEGIFARKLKVGTAYHSKHMEVIGDLYLASLADLELLPENAEGPKMFSSVTGTLVKNSELGPAYWVANMLNTVKFSPAVKALVNHSDHKRRRNTGKSYVDVMLEIGPHGALQGPVKQILADAKVEATILSALSRGQNCVKTSLAVSGRLFQHGYPVDIAATNQTSMKAKNLKILVDIPPFPWNHANKYWCESAWAYSYRFRKQPRNDLLGTLMDEWNTDEPSWRHFFRLSENPWIEDHSVHNTLLYPAAGMMVMALEAAAQIADPNKDVDGYELRDVLVDKALIVPRDEEGTETMLHLRPYRMGTQADTTAWNEFTIYSRPGRDEWSKNCTGLLRVKYKAKDAHPAFKNETAIANAYHKQRYAQAKLESTTTETSKSFYDHQFKIGLQLGATFRNLVEINKGDGQSACTVTIPNMASTMPHNYITKHVIHPCTLDAIIQTLLPTVEGRYEKLKTAAIPTYIERIFVSADTPSEPGVAFQTYSIAGYTGLTEAEACVYASTEQWEKPLVVFERIRATRLSALQDVSESSESKVSLRKIAGEFVWKEDVTNMENSDIQAFCLEALAHADIPNQIATDDIESAAKVYGRRLLNEITTDEAQTFPPHFQRLYEFMAAVIESTPSLISPEQAEPLLTRVAASSIDGALLRIHGEKLSAILRGEVDPADLMTKELNLSSMDSLGLGRPQALAQLAAYVDLLAHHSPDLKILEINAGSGALTATVFNALGEQGQATPWFKNYTVTDPDQKNVDAASIKYDRFTSHMTFKKLDINKDATEQDFKQGEFDLVLATGMSHQADLATALANVKPLLKEGGKLVLGETIRETLRLPIILAPSSKEYNLIPPSEEQISTSLRAQGYSGVDFTLPDYKISKHQTFSFLGTTLLPDQEKNLPNDVLIVQSKQPNADLKGLASALTSTLRAFGLVTQTITLDDISSTELTGRACVVLAEAEEPLLFGIAPADFEAVRSMILGSASTTWVTRGGSMDCDNPKLSLITGLSRTIRQETPGICLSVLDLDPAVPLHSASNPGFILKALRAHSVAKGDQEFAVRRGRIFIPRVDISKGGNELVAFYNTEPTPELLPFKQSGRALTLTVGTPGMLDTLYFKDDETYQEPLQPHEVEFEVKASGLNFMDIMVAMDQIQEPAVGLECSGIVTRTGSGVTKFKAGDRVMTWLLGSFSNYVRNAESMIQPIPAGMSFEIAASLPMIFCTAYASIVEEARLEKGESVLIHAAAGGVGQASIMIAQHIGAEIYATVGSQAKKEHIMQHYGIPEDHIFNSRDLNFVEGIKRMTNGKGVDVILNSLAGEALRESWHCLSWFGRFVELGKKDITGNTGLDMAPFLRNMSFHAVNVIGTLRTSVPRASRLFEKTMAFLNNGYATAVTPVTTMDFSQIEAGFRLLQSGKHVGKVVFVAHDEDLVLAVPSKIKEAKFDPNATYLLSGGLGGLGRSLSKWMVDHGAKNLAFFSRSGDKKADAREFLQSLREDGVRAAAYACDIGISADVANAVAQCQAEMPPIRGVIQAAMSLADAAYTNMTPEQWSLSVNPKAPGTWNLHEQLPKDLDFFVMLSSSSGIAGTRGQANYAAGNTFLDALAHHRVARGLPAVSVDVGPVLGAGYVAENSELIDSLSAQGYIALHEEEFLGFLQAAITGEIISGQPMPAQIVTGFATGGVVQAEGWDMPFYLEAAKMRRVVQVDVNGNSGSDAGAGWQSQLASIASVSQGADLVAAAMAAKLAKLMMVAAEDIDLGKPISTYGVDSLTAVEIRAWSFRELQSDISIFDIMSNVPISALARTIVARSKFVTKEIVEADG